MILRNLNKPVKLHFGSDDDLEIVTIRTLLFAVIEEFRERLNLYG